MFVSAEPGAAASVLYRDERRRLTTYRGGSLSWRLHNPGLLRHGLLTYNQGAIGRIEGYAAFPDYATGKRALIGMLDEAPFTLLTVNQALRRVLSHNPGVDPDGRCPLSGLPAHRPVRLLERVERLQLAEAIESSLVYHPGEILPGRHRKPAPGKPEGPSVNPAPVPGDPISSGTLEVLLRAQTLLALAERELREQAQGQLAEEFRATHRELSRLTAGYMQSAS